MVYHPSVSNNDDKLLYPHCGPKLIFEVGLKSQCRFIRSFLKQEFIFQLWAQKIRCFSVRQKDCPKRWKDTLEQVGPSVSRTAKPRRETNENSIDICVVYTEHMHYIYIHLQHSTTNGTLMEDISMKLRDFGRSTVGSAHQVYFAHNGGHGVWAIDTWQRGQHFGTFQTSQDMEVGFR